MGRISQLNRGVTRSHPKEVTMNNLRKSAILICCFSLFFSPFPAVALDTVILAYSPSLSFAPLFVAIEKGYLKEQGIELKLELFKSGSEAVAFAANGQIAGIAGGPWRFEFQRGL